MRVILLLILAFSLYLTLAAGMAADLIKKALRTPAKKKKKKSFRLFIH